jgi:alkanesulfonate monooxygenase SsuD/methylene tetrahydromethanopterin reductase-like flavin-dependent oxidoreductase (luciferase family)
MSIEFHWMQRNTWPNTEKGLIQMATELEQAGVKSVLLPYGPTGVDFSVHLSSVFKSTKKIRMMLALPAYGLTPEYAAKTFETLNVYGPGRVDLNLVAGKYEKDKNDFLIEHYPGDVSTIDTQDKRVVLTEPWMKKFVGLLKLNNIKAKLCVVGSSDITLRIADQYTDYIIVGNYQLNDKFLPKLKNTKPMLTIDPLILEDGEKAEDVQYKNYKYTLKPIHPIQGTHEEVVAQLKDFSNKFGVNDFMVITDQIDLTRIYKVIKELTNQ